MMEHLLAPVSEDAPCGEYLKGNRTLYRGLRNSFNVAQSSFRQLVESPDAAANEELLESNFNNWAELASQCEDSLSNTSKDIEVLCWLTTAQLFSREPLANLSAVLAVFSQTLDSFWQDLHPRPPEDKLKATDNAGRQQELTEIKVRPLLQLVGESEESGLLYMPLQMIPLIGDIDYSRYYAAERGGELEQLKAISHESLSSERDAVTATILLLGQILEYLQTMEAQVAEQCSQVGASGLSFRFVKQSIERLLNALRYLVGDLLAPWPLDKTAEAAGKRAPESADRGDLNPAATGAIADPAAQQIQAQGMVTLAPGGEIYTRDQAFQELRKISDFFSRTEPHSPVYMLLERAMRWGYMSLPELLQEMVGENDQVMGRITQMAGLESIEKTAIPEAKISAQALQQHQQGMAEAVSEPVATATESGRSIAANENKTPEVAASGVSSFEW